MGIVKICTKIFTKYVLNLVNIYPGIKAYANKRTNRVGEVKWRIIISKLSMNKLISLVCTHFIPEMLYKLRGKRVAGYKKIFVKKKTIKGFP